MSVPVSSTFDLAHHRAVRTLLAVLLLSCGGSVEPAPVQVATSPALEGDEEPHIEDWSTASPEAVLRETARRSCLEHARCRSYLCVPIGAMTEVCHPTRIEPRIARVAERINQGTLEFDRDVALRVLQELADGRACRAQRFSPRCDIGIDRTFEAVLGQQEAGMHCEDDADCVREHRCAYDERRGGRCVRRVEAPLPDGNEDCERNSDCAPGRICSVEEGCVAPIPEGGACGAQLGPSRLSSCVEGLVCTANGCGLGLDVGDTCSSGDTDPCRHGTICRDRRCVDVGAPWGACRGQCPESFVCNVGQCEPMPMIGERCSRECIDGVCADGTCVAVPIGQPCVGDIFGGKTCANGGVCDQRANRCVPQ